MDGSGHRWSLLGVQRTPAHQPVHEPQLAVDLLYPMVAILNLLGYNIQKLRSTRWMILARCSGSGMVSFGGVVRVAVLEVCCGCGDFSFLLSLEVGTNGKVTVVDFSKELLEVVAYRQRGWSLNCATKTLSGLVEMQLLYHSLTPINSIKEYLTGKELEKLALEADNPYQIHLPINKKGYDSIQISLVKNHALAWRTPPDFTSH
ncbi:2-phytyl-1-4-beta-naphthoquinone methyltransferase- chloroplastic [Striga hermonthica]|uniref:2-phytyl-1-4-beta-naphthoquinone methyltransferase- chloroplastic n=1 Tax=Striga hermonthica TaxID=68872 RepID=A0A9N7REW2_STRHE|nr:2-phytyl-1-4-beta-naphthoquinone methyltransferase- chloroplastic [Striga hermonthica]